MRINGRRTMTMARWLYGERLELKGERKRAARTAAGARERGQTGEGETGGTVKAVCFVSNCAAMIDDAVSGILLETLSVGSIDNSPGG